MIIKLIRGKFLKSNRKVSQVSAKLSSLSEGLLGRSIYRFDVTGLLGRSRVSIDEIELSTEIKNDLCVGCTAMIEIIHDDSDMLLGYRDIEVIDAPWSNPWMVAHSN